MSTELSQIEELEKGKCVRCGGKTSGGKGGRCAACLAKLRRAKKTPGSAQRAQTKADDALRRQKGKNGTAHKKHSGLGSRESIVKQTQAAEKKTGQRLSPDRKDNSKGYASSNTRMVPEKLNRGRHTVDPKKLAAWKKRLKKSELEADQFYTLLKARAIETQDQEMLELIKAIHEEFSAIEASDLGNKLLDIFEEVQELKKDSQSTIDKSKFKYKHAKTDDTHSHYNVHHDGNLVGQISIDKKTNAPSGGYVQPAFHNLLSHIGDSVKAFHIARNTSTDN